MLQIEHKGLWISQVLSHNRSHVRNQPSPQLQGFKPGDAKYLWCPPLCYTYADPVEKVCAMKLMIPTFNAIDVWSPFAKWISIEGLVSDFLTARGFAYWVMCEKFLTKGQSGFKFNTPIFFQSQYRVAVPFSEGKRGAAVSENAFHNKCRFDDMSDVRMTGQASLTSVCIGRKICSSSAKWLIQNFAACYQHPMKPYFLHLHQGMWDTYWVVKL